MPSSPLGGSFLSAAELRQLLARIVSGVSNEIKQIGFLQRFSRLADLQSVSSCWRGTTFNLRS